MDFSRVSSSGNARVLVQNGRFEIIEFWGRNNVFVWYSIESVSKDGLRSNYGHISLGILLNIEFER